jgi:hypothetical protein
MTKTINLQTTFYRRLTYGISWLFLFALLAPVSFGAGLRDLHPADPPSKSEASKREMEKHLSKAKSFEDQANSYRAEIEARWKKYAVERRKIAVIPKMVGENPHVRNLRKQTEREVAELAKLAREAEESAQFHRLRASEYADEE